MLSTTDIDIDFADKEAAQEGLPCIAASLINSAGRRQRHASGLYFQNIAVDPITSLAAFDYKEASDLGYFKVDFLTLWLYEGLESEEHLERLINTEPEWDLLEHQNFVEDNDLFQIANHFYALDAIKPRSVEDLAVVVALTKPGKKYLLGKPRAEIDAAIWKPEPESAGYCYKRAHAIAYATTIVVHLNRIWELKAKELDEVMFAED